MTAYQKHRMPNRRFSVYLLTQIAVVRENHTVIETTHCLLHCYGATTLNCSVDTDKAV
jgi:hypothetical protein